MTFQKGQSGNPGGRPKAYTSFRETAQQHMDTRGVKRLLSMAEGEGEDCRFALRMLAEYAYGRPQQHVDVTSAGEQIKAYVGVDLDRV